MPPLAAILSEARCCSLLFAAARAPLLAGGAEAAAPLVPRLLRRPGPADVPLDVQLPGQIRRVRVQVAEQALG